jgi:hypothetical protein
MRSPDSTSRRLGASAAALLAAAALISACGGSSSVSGEDFVSQGDRVCRQNLQQFDHIQRKPPRTATQAKVQADALIQVAQDALDELRDLTPPEDAQAAYDRYLAAREDALGFLEDGRDAAAANDPKAYAAAKRKAAAEQASRLQLARAVGLTACSRPSVSLGAPSS